MDAEKRAIKSLSLLNAWIEAQMEEHHKIIMSLVNQKGGNLFMAGGHAVATEALGDVRNEIKRRMELLGSDEHDKA